MLDNNGNELIVIMAYIFRRIWNSYNHVLAEHPWKTQIIQTGILCGTGDLLSQVLVEKKETLEPVRIARFTFLGLFLVAPAVRVWYHTLEKLVSVSKTAGLKKMMLDQLCFAPCFMPVFLGTNFALTGMKLPQIQEQIKQDYVDIMLTNWSVWPGVQLFNFYVIPLEYRILLVQVVALGWNTYLGWKANSDAGKSKAE